MKLVRNRKASRVIRYCIWLPLAIWLLLAFIGFFFRKPPSKPQIGGKSLWKLCEELPWHQVETESEREAINLLRENRDEVFPTLQKWAQRRESPPRFAYFTTMGVILGKRFSLYEYGEEAHVFRGYAARSLGWLEPSDSEARAELGKIASDPRNFDYEREIAKRGLKRY